MALVAWYKLDGNGLDSSGNGNHGSVVGATAVAGKIGQAMDFTSGTKNITIPHHSSLDCPSQLSVSAWVKITDYGRATIISKWYEDFCFAIQKYDGESTTRVWVWYSDGVMPYTSINVNLDCLVQDGEWHHIVMTLNKAEGVGRWWVDGRFSAEGFSEPRVGSMTRPLYIGARNGSANRFHGIIDDVRLYNHILSDKEIKELSKALVLHYKFDDFQEPTQNILGTITPSYSKWGTNEGTSTYFTAPNGNQGVCLEITSFTDGGVNWYNTGGQRNAEPSAQYTVSATIKYEGGTPHPNLLYLRQYRSDGTQISEAGQFSTSYIEDLGNGWYRAYRTFTTHAECAKLAIQGYEYKKIKIWIYDIQCEKKAYHTPYVANDRAGVIYDCSGYDNHAELQLETTPRWTSEAKIGDGAYDFAGVGKAINFIKPIPKLQEFTLSAWVYNVQGDSRQSIIRNFWEVVGTSIAFWSYDFTDEYWRQSPSGVVPYGQWTHIATTWDGSVIRHYANGELVYTSATSSGTSQEFLGIAGYSGRNFSGKLDDVRIYATALSDDDIKELYQTRVALDSHGNLYASEVMDLDSKILSNGGHVWDFRYGLTSISGLKPLGVE